jgi:hypothetical protein
MGTDRPVQRDLHLLIAPGALRIGSQEHGGAGAALDRLLELLLPGSAGREVPHVDERIEVRFVAQPAAEQLDGRLVPARMREEHVESCRGYDRGGCHR